MRVQRATTALVVWATPSPAALVLTNLLKVKSLASSVLLATLVFLAPSTLTSVLVATTALKVLLVKKSPNVLAVPSDPSLVVKTSLTVISALLVTTALLRHLRSV